MCRTFVKWEEKETESGIKLQGMTTVTRRGEVIGTQAFPMQGPQGMGFMVTLVVRRVDDNKIVVVDGMTCTAYDPENDSDIVTPQK